MSNLSNNDIEIYLNKMENILNNDIIKKILTIINIDIINKQKRLKFTLNKEIKEYRDIYYKDKNYIIFRNEYDNLILKKRNNFVKNNYKFFKLNDLDNLDSSSNYIIHSSNLIMNNISNSSNFKLIVKYV
jgi:hypothetical protein